MEKIYKKNKREHRKNVKLLDSEKSGVRSVLLSRISRGHNESREMDSYDEKSRNDGNLREKS